MLIACPSCATPYEIDASVIGAKGRSVRCVRCKSVWFTPPPAATAVAAREPEPAMQGAQAGRPPAADAAAEEAVAAFRSELGAEAQAGMATDHPAGPQQGAGEAPNAGGTGAEDAGPPLAEESVEPDRPADTTETQAAGPPADAPAVALADIPIPVEDAPPLAPTDDDGIDAPTDTREIENGREDIESVARRRSRSAERRRRGRRAGWLPGIILALAAVCLAVLGWRKDIARHMPQLASFYASIGLAVNLRGLEFTELKAGSETHDGVPVLLVEGVIVNTVSVPVEVPRLRFALRNDAGSEVYAWTAMPTQSALEPGGRLPFRSRLASPPKDGHDVQVRFFTRHDVQAGSR